MGFEYALVHLKYTIPPAIALTFLYRPLCTRVDLYKVLFLISVAVIATTPWDSYLIRRKIWTYPPSVIIGPTLVSIPAEEVFFFVVQTYNTCLVYLLLSKPLVKTTYLVGTKAENGRLLPRLKLGRVIGQIILSSAIISGVALILKSGTGTYMGLILAWAGPFALFLWTLAYQFLQTLPYMNTTLPIALPTLYLWLVDTLALQRGTWSIESGTKLGIYLWPGLEVEEAVFFLATNTLIVMGLVAFENAVAVAEAFPALVPDLPGLPPPFILIKALLTDPAKYDNERIEGIQDAVTRLQRKSRSFYLASSVFQGKLRIDLILLYSFCRVADDLVDNADSEYSARIWISKLSEFLDYAYTKPDQIAKLEEEEKSGGTSRIIPQFPPSARTALSLLPTQFIPSKPLYELLCGFRTDLEFPGVNPQSREIGRNFPIRDESDLELYASRVAGTVAELCLELVFHHSPMKAEISRKDRQLMISAGGRMGIALQYVNIARDVATDAAIGRVYLPASWLKEEGLRPEDVIEQPEGASIGRLRTRLLGKAFNIYGEARGAMARLPQEARAPMRVAVESYMEIGRVLSEKGYKIKSGKPTVPRLRRIMVAWKALKEG